VNQRAAQNIATFVLVYFCYAWHLQIVIGAELGALTAFGLARVLGRHDALRRVFGTSVDAGLLGSQAAVQLIVLTMGEMVALPVRDWIGHQTAWQVSTR
jgi:hypothetical protein